MIDEVTALVEQVARDVVLPRHRALREGEVEEKSPGELVTVADREAEVALAAGLLRLLPGSVVVGEEAVATDTGLLDHLPEGEDVWLVDPVDGTSNFVAGSDDFAVMVALVRRGTTVASWVHRPSLGTTYVAERGSGAWRDGERLRVPDTGRVPGQLRVEALTRYLTADQRAAVTAGSPRVGQVGPGHRCAGVDHPLVADGERDAVVFWRTLPWDHAPGALLVTEAGGVAQHLDGSDYRPGTPRTGLVVARDAQTRADVVRLLGLS